MIEVGSNDGYLLKNFVEKRVPCLGIEPTESTSKAAGLLGVNTINNFFDHKLAKKLAKRLEKLIC